MKTLILLILLIIPFTMQAGEAYDYSWSKIETTLFSSYAMLSIIDVGQTNYGLNQGYYEQNPLYGKHPTRLKISLIKALGVGIAYIFFDYVPTGKRKIFLYAINALQLGVVTHNCVQPGVGLNLKF